VGGLSGGSGDQVEFGVIVEHGGPVFFPRLPRSQVGNLASSLTALGQEALDLRGAAVVGGGVDRREGVQRVDQLIPLVFVAGGVSDLKIGNAQRIQRCPDAVVATAERAVDCASRCSVRRCAFTDMYAASCTARATGVSRLFAAIGGR